MRELDGVVLIVSCSCHSSSRAARTETSGAQRPQDIVSDGMSARRDGYVPREISLEVRSRCLCYEQPQREMLLITRACLSGAIVGPYCWRAYRLLRLYFRMPGYLLPARCSGSSICARSDQGYTFPGHLFLGTVLPLAASTSRLPGFLVMVSERSWHLGKGRRSYRYEADLSTEQS